MGARESGKPARHADRGAPGQAAGAADKREREAMYRALTGVTDLDALHELVAAKGVEVLDFPFPYLVVAVRNRRRDQLRRDARTTHHEQDLSDVDISLPAPRSLWDPLEQVMASDELRRTLEALASMDDRDVLVVWSSAQGLSDEEIASEWDSLGLSPSHPTPTAIRKRRGRAREELRRKARRQR
jgi:hypothetical protein